MQFDQINWREWQPNMVATLLFIVKDDEVLLIHKKTGMGKGKINGPGGKVEEGETPVDAAIRECEEELLITPIAPIARGIIRFQFMSDLRLECHVFSACEFKGTPQETIEAKPFWSKLNEIPYEKMWEDDQYWIPAMLTGHNIDGYFLFDDEKMVDMLVSTNTINTD